MVNHQQFFTILASHNSGPCHCWPWTKVIFNLPLKTIVPLKCLGVAISESTPKPSQSVIVLQETDQQLGTSWSNPDSPLDWSSIQISKHSHCNWSMFFTTRHNHDESKSPSNDIVLGCYIWWMSPSMKQLMNRFFNTADYYPPWWTSTRNIIKHYWTVFTMMNHHLVVHPWYCCLLCDINHLQPLSTIIKPPWFPTIDQTLSIICSIIHPYQILLTFCSQANHGAKETAINIGVATGLLAAEQGSLERPMCGIPGLWSRWR